MESLERRRVRGDLIALYKGIIGIKSIDRDQFEMDTGSTRGHSKKLGKTRCVRCKKYRFPYWCIDS